MTEKVDLKFTPPVCVQRYEAMKEMVKKFQPKKVLDMGCGECSLLRQLKHDQSIEQLTGVDVDKDVLQTHRHLAKPLMCEYLNPRSHPFTVSLYEGSISQKDARMVGYDLVLCVEIIEHLYPDTLAAIPEVVFGYMQPRVVVFTTPNADFNVLFPDFQGFRHWDHKFEWSREEFQLWGNQVASNYSYSVTYEGIGAGPPGTEHLGCCTQMAVFMCMLPPQEGSRHHDCGSETPYTLVCEIEYPHREITMTIDEQILSEATFYLRRLSHSSSRCYSADTDADDTGSHDAVTKPDVDERRTSCVSLETMMKYSSLRKICPSIEKLREVLASCQSMSLCKDGQSIMYSIGEDVSDNSSSSDESNPSDVEADDCKYQNTDENCTSSPQQQEECWDW